MTAESGPTVPPPVDEMSPAPPMSGRKVLDRMRHRERHPAAAGPVAGCGPCRWRSVQLSPAATPSRQVDPNQYAYMSNFAAEFSNGDREAYRRLRADGLQPPRIAGSADLEARASTRYEVETGQVAEHPAALKEALKIADSSGFDPMRPATQERAAG